MYVGTFLGEQLALPEAKSFESRVVYNVRISSPNSTILDAQIYDEASYMAIKPWIRV